MHRAAGLLAAKPWRQISGNPVQMNQFDRVSGLLLLTGYTPFGFGPYSLAPGWPSMTMK
jgi:hypothetical protein